MLGVMSSLRRSLALAVALVALTTGSPLGAASCPARKASDCPCPMQHARDGESCAKQLTVGAAMDCCRQAPTEAIAPASAGIGGVEHQVAAAQPTGEVVDLLAPHAPMAAGSAWASSPFAKRSPTDLCTLHSVFRI
jgi:hypothetical protein